MDIREIVRHIRANRSNRAVQEATGVDRRAVKQYREWATQQGLLNGPMPTLEELQKLVETTLVSPTPSQKVSSAASYTTMVQTLRQEGVEVAAIWQRLKEKGFTGSYWSVYRLVRQLEPDEPEVTVRVERKPGEEVQVDFGYAGRLIDASNGQARKAWAFVMTLSWSRHQYVEFVFDQKVDTWLLLHRHAFEFFEGVPQRVVIDNLKAGISQACWDEPQVQTMYRECAEHYGFLIAPCRPRTPEHKGKVEQGGVHYVKRNFLGGRAMTTLGQANEDVLVWCRETAGQRKHGTTKEQPLTRFQTVEQARLNALPETPFDAATWKVVKVHRDCYITFAQAYYSAPFRLVGQQVRVRGGVRQVRLYTLDFRLVATHERASQPGQRQTHHDHLPPHKVPGLLLERQPCQAEADTIGPSTSQVVATLLADPVVDRLPTVGRLLRLRQRYGDSQLEAACERALQFGDPAYKTVKRILGQGLTIAETEPVLLQPPAETFVRQPDELVAALFGGVTWK